MKNRILIFLLSLVVIASCNKAKLEPDPQADLPDEQAFATAQRAQQQVNGIYALLKSSFFLRKQVRRVRGCAR